MKTFSLILQKKILIIDLAFHYIILLAFIILISSLIKINDKEFYFFYFYFVVGGWQVLSFLFYHVLSKYFLVKEKEKRNFYGKVVLIIFAIIGTCLIFSFDIIFAFAIILLIISPFLAIFYFFILLDELKNVNLKLKNA